MHHDEEEHRFEEFFECPSCRVLGCVARKEDILANPASLDDVANPDLCNENLGLFEMFRRGRVVRRAKSRFLRLTSRIGLSHCI
jgi:hypothetical protein